MHFPCLGELVDREVSCVVHVALPHQGLPSFPGVMDALCLQLGRVASSADLTGCFSLVMVRTSSPCLSPGSLPAPGPELPPSCRRAAGGSGAATRPPRRAVVSSMASAPLGLSMELWLPGLAPCWGAGCSPFLTLQQEQKRVREGFVRIWIELFCD